MCQRLSSCRSVSLCAHRTHAASPSHTSLPWSCLHSSSKQRLHTGGLSPMQSRVLVGGRAHWQVPPQRATLPGRLRHSCGLAEPGAHVHAGSLAGLAACGCTVPLRWPQCRVMGCYLSQICLQSSTSVFTELSEGRDIR